MSELTAVDEGLHTPDLSVYHWQENMLFHGWSRDFQDSFYLHLQHIPQSSEVEVRAAATVQGTTVSMVRKEHGRNVLDVKGLEFVVDVPFEKHKLSFHSDAGALGTDDLGWLCSRTGDVSFGFEIDFVSRHVPLHFNPITSALVPDDPTNTFHAHNHYEMGAEWSGRVDVAGQSASSRGLMWRDHTWGPRDFHSEGGFWTPMVFEGATRFVGGITKRYQGTWYEFAAEATGEGVNGVFDRYIVRTDVDKGQVLHEALAVALADDDRRIFEVTTKRVVAAPRNWDVSGVPGYGLVDHVVQVTNGDSIGMGSFQVHPIAPSDLVASTVDGV